MWNFINDGSINTVRGNYRRIKGWKGLGTFFKSNINVCTGIAYLKKGTEVDNRLSSVIKKDLKNFK